VTENGFGRHFGSKSDPLSSNKIMMKEREREREREMLFGNVKVTRESVEQTSQNE
jgi:hypothetical protein